ncbi:MAG: phenylacetate--CoA ligase family protein, partial [Hamadaea sp.]|nr:phenylacetate--CoA ligase family protein [Hamadaea sp.]
MEEATSAVQRRIARYRAEMIFQARLFPRIHTLFQRYLARPADTPDRLLALQRRRLTRTLDHARARVPAYHGSVGAGGNPDPWRVLAGFPLVTKAELRERLSDHCDDRIDPRRCRSVKTSGTTGEPLRIVHDFDHLCHAYALGLVRAHQDGLPLDRRILYPFHTALDRWFEYTAPAYGLARIAEFGALGDDAYWADVVRRVRGYRPHVVVGHPTRCLELADLLEGAGGLGFRPPRLISTWGERLSAGGARRLSEFFQAPVRDSYGMSEVGTIAGQCEHGNYHVEAERLWVEILSDTGAPVAPGEIGEVVLTNLINRAMPLVRYRT